MKKGIDISYHQGAIDFSKVKKCGIDFVILRSSYRKTTDTRFFEYVKKCKGGKPSYYRGIPFHLCAQ